jgi:hypothetical protein
MKSGRPKSWYLWPSFYDAEDAQDGAKMGVFFCAIIAIYYGFAAFTAAIDIFEVYFLISLFVIFAFLSYGIFKMSRLASSTALILYTADRLLAFYYEGKFPPNALGIFFVIWYLVQANRAVYWFRREQKKKRQGGQNVVDN